MRTSTTSLARPDPTAPWTLAEAVARLPYVLEACADDYHFTPSPADHEALDYLASLVAPRARHRRARGDRNGLAHILLTRIWQRNPLLYRKVPRAHVEACLPTTEKVR